jgi:hypothetical protein
MMVAHAVEASETTTHAAKRVDVITESSLVVAMDA